MLELRALQPDNSMNIDPRAACVTLGLVLTSLGSLAAQDLSQMSFLTRCILTVVALAVAVGLFFLAMTLAS